MNYVLTPYKRTIDLIFENNIKFINKDSEKGICFKLYPIQGSALILPYLNFFVSNEDKMPKLLIGSTYHNLSSMIVLFKNNSMWGNITLNGEGSVSLKEKDKLVMLAKNHHYEDFKLQQGLIKIILEEKCKSKLILEKYLELISRLPRTLDYKYYSKNKLVA